MLCQRCGETADVREITATDFRQSPPQSVSWRYCLRCLQIKGYWCAYHRSAKLILLDTRHPTDSLPHTVRSVCLACCKEKALKLPESVARAVVKLLREARPELIEDLDRRAAFARLPRSFSRARRLSFGLVFAAELYRVPLTEITGILARGGTLPDGGTLH